MSDITVKDLAKANNLPVVELITQFDEAGVSGKSEGDVVTSTDKMKLLDYLRDKSGSARPVMHRKKIEQRQVKGKVVGKGSTVSIEVRKKRVYVKEKMQTAAEPEPVAPSPANLPVTDMEVEASAAVADTVMPKQQFDTSAPAVYSPSVDKGAVLDKSGIAAEQKKEEKFEKELHVAKEKRGKLKFKKKRISRKKITQVEHQFEKPTKPVKREVRVYPNMTVKDLAQGMAIKGAELIKQMFDMGMKATINQTLDQDTAVLVVEEIGHTAKIIKDKSVEDILVRKPVADELTSRAPVVTVMGHVDHGKTSLLDCIRKSQVVTEERGGITQHIGAYRIKTDKGELTFLDTPGHAAFTRMRMRGAKLTDIIVLVVAADDGVMPQTEESIRHAQVAEVPLIVAINKIDKPDSDIEKIKSDLAQKNVLSEQWGGDTIFVEVSAHTGHGIGNLLEAILLQAEFMELKAAATGPASGMVIESALDKGRGAVATILVQQGELKKSDILVAGKEYGRVRTLFDENYHPLGSAKPSTPVLVLGLSGIPAVGEQAVVVEDERQAKDIVELRRRKAREVKLAGQTMLGTAENFLSSEQDKETAVVKILLKTDVQGSAEALADAIMGLTNEEVKAEIIDTGIGAITESDINLAAAAGAMVIGFNVRADARARKALGGINHVQIRYYGVIYEALDDIKQMMSGLLEPEIKEEIIGMAEVKEVFRSSKFGAVAGCQVTEGMVRRGRPIRVLRDNVVIYEGELESLRRFKDEVEKVSSGTECGIAVKNYNDVKVGDSIEVYERTEVKRELDG